MKCLKCNEEKAKYVVKKGNTKKLKNERIDFSAKCKCGWEGILK